MFLGFVWLRYLFPWTPTENISFESEKLRLAGVLILPRGEGPHPAVVQVSGSGLVGKNSLSMRLHANALARQGVAVLCYDKRGIGQSGGKYKASDYRNLVTDIHSAFNYLKSRSDIDSGALGYVGHSEGALLMPEVALERDDIKFAYLRVGPVLGYKHFTAFQKRQLMKAWGMLPHEIDEMIGLMMDTSDYYIRSQGDPQYFEGPARDALQLRLDEVFRKYEKHASKLFTRRKFYQGPYRDGFVRYIGHSNSYDPRVFLEQRIGIPMYCVYGELDESIDTASSVAYLEGLRSRTGQEIEIDIYPGESHSLFHWTHLPFGGYPQGYCERMTNWIRERFTEANERRQVRSTSLSSPSTSER
ncbi:MAG: hypothetical protein CMJ81_18450 [Planctomycetaceae bacterium]|nr:hypothetical protein [Planctomycetaceae bacterium]